jgi:hypothetical protein
MSNVRKCDACGALAPEGNDQDDDDRPQGWTEVEVNGIGDDGKPYNWNSDLCQSCAPALHKAAGNTGYHGEHPPGERRHGARERRSDLAADRRRATS